MSEPQSITDVNGTSIPISTLSTIIAEYGSSSATTWIEQDHYKLWRPSSAFPDAPFQPLQGFLHNEPYIFPWGNPVVPSPDVLEKTALSFIEWAESQDYIPIWCCVNYDLEVILAHQLRWSTVTCIHEDVLDPAHVIDMVSDEHKGKEGAGHAKDLKKNIRRAEKEGVVVKEIRQSEWTEEDKQDVNKSVEEWKRLKAGKLASSAFDPWLDSEHRRYWLARQSDAVVGLLILTPVKNASYQVKTAVSFNSAPKGTSEELVYSALKDIHAEHSCSPSRRSSTSSDRDSHDLPYASITFGVSASSALEPVENLKGWMVTWVAKTYDTIAQAAGLAGRENFRRKFDVYREPMYVCYPQDRFGLLGLNSLLKILRR